MGRTRTVALENCALYEVGEYDGRFYVRKVKVGILTSSRYDVCTTRTLDYALALVKSDSGSRIKRIGSTELSR